MKKINSFAGVMAMLLLFANVYGQSSENKIRSTDFPVFPKINNSNIPGAPILGQPFLVNGTQQEIRTEKHGLAYPALYDWNKDGKTDLLVGEFETGQTGSNIKVYLNEGSNKQPKYSGKYFYAIDKSADTITNYQWCCIGIHPRLVDINGDGIIDILSGQYNPGLISLWKGTSKGFEPRVYVKQQGYTPGAKLSLTSGKHDEDINNFWYWNYSSAAFADFDGDGLQDLFVGGSGSELRVALNVGTLKNPEFGLRKHLLGVDGLPLSIVSPSELEIKEAKKQSRLPYYLGVDKSFVTPVDWDGDGVLDLLVTHAYYEAETKDPVIFFKGFKTDKGLRFDAGKPLFTAKEAAKTFPGCQPNITVADYNNDGVPDLIIGISLPTINGFQIDSNIAWSYLRDIGIETPGKDAGRAVEYEKDGMAGLIKKINESPEFKKYYLGKLEDMKYLSLRHRGYVYVMLGQKNPVKAEAIKNITAREVVTNIN